MTHGCPQKLEDKALFGEAFNSVVTTEELSVSDESMPPAWWWAENNEYASRIKFCPWCGIELEKVIEKEKEKEGQ